MSKGSWRRPCLVTQKKYSDNWDKIFGKKKEKKQEERKNEDQDTNGSVDSSTSH